MSLHLIIKHPSHSVEKHVLRRLTVSLLPPAAEMDLSAFRLLSDCSAPVDRDGEDRAHIVEPAACSALLLSGAGIRT